MPVCPNCSIEVTRFMADTSAYFYDCPRCNGRFLGTTWSLLPVPKAVVSAPPSGYLAVDNLYQDEEGSVSVTGNLTTEISGMIYKELNATGVSAGDLNLTDTKWAVSKAKIDYIKVEVASGTVGDYDITVFEKDTFEEADIRYQVEGLNSDEVWEDELEWTYTDDDSTKEVHLRITENDGTGTYNVQIRGVKLT